MFLETENTYRQSLETFNKLYDKQKKFVYNGSFKDSPYNKIRVSNKYGFCEFYEFEDSPIFVTVIVSPKYQGKGYGEKLFKQAEAKAKANGYKKILCRVKVQNVNSLKLVKKIRFKLIGEDDVHKKFIKNI